MMQSECGCEGIVESARHTNLLSCSFNSLIHLQEAPADLAALLEASGNPYPERIAQIVQLAHSTLGRAGIRACLLLHTMILSAFIVLFTLSCCLLLLYSLPLT